MPSTAPIGSYQEAFTDHKIIQSGKTYRRKQSQVQKITGCKIKFTYDVEKNDF